jgi:hypothetical protein
MVRVVMICFLILHYFSSKTRLEEPLVANEGQKRRRIGLLSLNV